MARRPALSAWPACSAGAAQEEHLLLLRIATAAGLVLDACTCWFVSPQTSGLAWRGRQRGVQLDGEFAFYASRHRLRAWLGLGGRGARSWTLSLLFYASRHQLRAWPGWGGGGVRCLGMELAFLSFTHLPLDRRPSYAQSLVPTPSKTVDQTLPP